MKKLQFLPFIILVVGLTLISCAGKQTEDSQASTQPEIKAETVNEELEVAVTEGVEAEPEVVVEPSETDLEYARSVAGFEGEISYDIFQNDKNEILAIIAKLDESMVNRDYQLWRSYLTPSSITYWSNRLNLQILSTRLPGDNAVLTNLSQYFTSLFIPSRIGRQVTEIRYDSLTAVKAVQVQGDTDLVYYDFVKEDGKWLVSLPRL